MSIGTFAVDGGDTVFGALRAYGENPSAFLAMDEGEEYFTVAGRHGVIPYRDTGGHLHQSAGVIAAHDGQEPLLRAFTEFAGERRRKVVATRLRRPEAQLFARCGFTVNQAGSSYSVYLPEFRLGGPRLADLRLAVSRAWLAGLQAAEAAYEEIAAGTGDMADGRRVFEGRIGDEAVASITYLPVFGTRPGWLHHTAHRVPGAPEGALEAVNLEAVRVFAAEEAQWLHLGFTPFAGLGAQYELGSASVLAARLLRLAAERGEWRQVAAGRLAYQRIWDPHLVQPGYLAWQGRAAAGALGELLRLAKSP
ncbi:phosphatidylglycerol lysyltransferase domain-containing protein [Streptomyces sp. BPTC-684]|uniref:phosphatidylglycerol lysyltransferase domain-containing protein n=1 Tax=Streptomyces sp. BPTC-684 TaxID=3043734 RepID=UPI0024B043B6|nr:phosphatidylglycerol lysyltransferase domain-containing protein [Streptomyces sp. BPTC-684]WHM35472.1 phosphatidylglycerol lysyltransferase domain-containing protein [Streptomyces sp. BPTC-684]